MVFNERGSIKFSAQKSVPRESEIRLLEIKIVKINDGNRSKFFETFRFENRYLLFFFLSKVFKSFSSSKSDRRII